MEGEGHEQEDDRGRQNNRWFWLYVESRFLKIFTYTHDMKAAVRRERLSEKEGRRLWRRTI